MNLWASLWTLDLDGLSLGRVAAPKTDKEN